MHWFDEARFGMFIHWGLYALPARHEWVKNREKLDDEHYDRYFQHFDPDLYDPAAWARQAREAGMRYMVLTTKHHDGFCLWPSKLTDYSVAQTPYGKDLVGPFVEACHAEGLKVGFYHSLIDWHHPSFPIDGLHPQRDQADELGGGRDMADYVTYLHGQIRELLTEYGTIDYLFFDFSYTTHGIPGGKGADDWKSSELLRLVRELQPNILVNDRLEIPGDFVTPEQYQPVAPMRVNGELARWEACHTFSGSWGYHRDEQSWKPADLLLRMFIDGVAKGGNMLLNVGPTARGEIDERASDRLAAMGDWMRLHERSIRGAGASDFTPPPDCRYTQRGNRLYLHIFAWPFGHVHLPDMSDRVEYAQFLHDGSEVAMRRIAVGIEAWNTAMGGLPEGTLTLELPVHRPNVAVPVIELFLK